MNKKMVQAISILISYIVIFGIVFGVVLNSESSVVFVVYIVLAMVFCHKATNGAISDKLSGFMWPVWLVGTILISGVVGTFVAPYYVGKWIAEKITKGLENNTSL